MNTPWKIIFGYRLTPRSNAQAVYDAIFKAALTHKFKGLKNFAVPIDGKTLTEAIFNLNVHDEVPIDRHILSGQKVKELFITTIFLKSLERKFSQGDYFFIVIPNEENSCDTAVMVAKSDKMPVAIDNRQLKLPPEHYPFEFQIKEQFNYKRLKSDDILTPRKADAATVSSIAGNYTENILIFMRDFMNYSSEDFEVFFEKHPNCYLISASDFVRKDDEVIPLDVSKHNYVISYPGKTMSIESFDWPKFLVRQK